MRMAAKLASALASECHPRDHDSGFHSGEKDYLEMVLRRPLVMIILILFGILVIMILIRLKWWCFRARFSPAETNKYYKNVPTIYESHNLPSACKIVPV